MFRWVMTESKLENVTGFLFSAKAIDVATDFRLGHFNKKRWAY